MEGDWARHLKCLDENLFFIVPSMFFVGTCYRLLGCCIFFRGSLQETEGKTAIGDVSSGGNLENYH